MINPYKGSTERASSHAGNLVAIRPTMATGVELKGRSIAKKMIVREDL